MEEVHRGGGRGERQIKENLNGTSSHHVTFFALQSTAGEASSHRLPLVRLGVIIANHCSGQKHDSFSNKRIHSSC